jgi:hypothetical protein
MTERWRGHARAQGVALGRGDATAADGCRHGRGFLSRAPRGHGSEHAARWIELPVVAGQHFLLDTATLNVLGYYRDAPAVQIWNAPIVR